MELSVDLGDGFSLSLMDGKLNYGTDLLEGGQGSVRVDGWNSDQDFTITKNGNQTRVDGWNSDQDLAIIRQ